MRGYVVDGEQGHSFSDGSVDGGALNDPSSVFAKGGDQVEAEGVVVVGDVPCDAFHPSIIFM